MNVQSKTYDRPHRSSQYADMSWLIGEPLEIRGGLDLEANPDHAEVIAEYPNTLLLEMIFAKSIWAANIPPRKVRVMIPKASIICGDVRLFLEHVKKYVTADMVSDQVGTEQVIVKGDEWN